MATYIFHRLIMGKVEIDNIFCLNGDIWKTFLQKCLLSSPLCFRLLLSKSLNLIGCQGDKNGKFSEKKLQNPLLRNQIRWMKLILCIHVYDICLYIILFFRSDKNSGCYGNFNFPQKIKNGKSENLHLFLSQQEYLEHILQFFE